MLTFDLETDGFVEDVTRIHCLCIHDDRDDSMVRYRMRGGNDAEIVLGLERLATADVICGHNVIQYDLPVIHKLYPKIDLSGPRVIDTIILTRLAFPDLSTEDAKLIAHGKLPMKHMGAHKLEAWGYRIGILKGEYTGDPNIEDPKLREGTKWAAFNDAMLDYNEQDVRVTYALWHRSQKWSLAPRAVNLEHSVAHLIAKQIANGFTFDKDAAEALKQRLLIERAKVEGQLVERVGQVWVAKGSEKAPKKDDAKKGYTAGVSFRPVQAVPFNPTSRHHIGRVLTKRYGWKPQNRTETGLAEITEESLRTVKDPIGQLLIDQLTISKRLGQLAEGKQAWLNFVQEDGRIHGGVNTLGTVTGRMSHSNPNVAQVPATRSPYGKECRALFKARDGWKLVGADASGLELRALAHYMAAYDGGAYAKTVVEGRKEDGTDVHSITQKALGIDSRDDAKTWMYAFLYGAAPAKLGSIITKTNSRGRNTSVGRTLLERISRGLPALTKLRDAVVAKATDKKRGGFLVGLDGRKLHIRSEHAALNTLLQSAGAVVMKQALVNLHNALTERGLKHGNTYAFCANVHDEFQIECRPEIADEIGTLAVQAIRKAGEDFKLRCPLDGEYVVGRTWADTH